MKVGFKISSILFGILVFSMVVSCAAPPAASPSATQAQSGPKYGGALRMVAVTTPTLIDPQLALDAMPRALAHMYSVCLMRWTGKNDNEARLEPWLANSYEVSPDRLVYTFKLHEGVKWQNVPPVNGREVTSDDIKYSMERMANPKTRSPFRQYLASVDRIETPDKYTIKIFLKEVWPSFLVSMSAGSSSLIPREVIEQDGNANKTVIGPGPFIFEEYIPNVKLTLRKNPDYFEKGKPYLDRVEITFVPDEAQRIAAFRGGETDRITGTFTTMDAIKKTVPDVNIVPGIMSQGAGLFISPKLKPEILGSSKVRQAIRYAIDNDALIRMGLDGGGYLSDFLGPLYYGWGAKRQEELPKRDVAKAKKLLGEAGYPNGFKTWLPYNSTALNLSASSGEPIVAMLKEVGIDVELKTQDATTSIAMLQRGEFEIGLANTAFNKPDDPDINLFHQYYSKGSLNYTGYTNTKLDSLLEAQRKPGASIDERKRAVKEILAILNEDLPLIPIYIHYRYHLAQSWVKGWDNLADGNDGFSWHQILNIWLDKK